ncbi:hypothetical protein CLU95_1093 [Variovorax sp. 54]|uniref:Ig-like domain-containing protein n=1 Tax=Variovorax sp. 54 TaxID=2035212 RepID=UPI000C1A5227|nr:Ig-like domain-containing protein [Variovorax sp. 54]PIF73972.1 hypothetical protein CLU95_1093 [Variovorax sp. 54]
MASEKTRVIADDQTIDPAASASAQTFAALPPVIGGAVDNAGDIQNPLASGGVTDDRQPGFHGQGTPGDTIVIKDNGVEIGKVDVEANGTWTFTPSVDMTEGSHAVTVVARDTSGNESQPSAAFNFEIDVTPPDASQLTVTGVTDTVGGITGNVISGATTDDARPLLSGISTGTPGHTVTVLVKDASGVRELGQAVIGEDGHWTFQVEAPLASGLNTLMLVERDTAGNETAPTGRYQVNVATDKPTAPVIESVFDDVGSRQSELYSGDFTDDTKPVVTGKAEAGSTVIVYDNGVEVDRVQANASGDWTYTPAAALVDGGHSISAVAMNKAGTASVPSASFGFTVDTEAPAAPTIASVYDDQGTVTGNLTQGQVTDDAKPAINGLAEANSTVVIYDGVTEIGRVKATASGDWSFTPATVLVNGNHSISAKAIDAAGNMSPPSANFDFSVAVLTTLTEDFETDATQLMPNIGDTADSGVFTLTQLGKPTKYSSAVNGIGPGYLISAGVDPTKAWGISGAPVRATLNNGVQASEITLELKNSQAAQKIEFFDKSGNLLFNQTFTADFLGQDFTFKMPGGVLFSSFVITPGLSGGQPDYIEIDNISMKAVIPGISQFSVASALIEQSEPQPLVSPAGLAHSGHESGVLDHSTQVHAESDETLIAKLGFADRLSGGAGNDTISNVGTADVVHGGAGDDTVRVNSGDFERVDGGLGIDTLVMDGKAMNIDLSAFGLKIQGFEKFDLGAGGNKLSLHASDVLAGGVRDMVTVDGKVQMLVNGTNGDVDLLGGNDGWTQGNAATVGGVTYSVYTNLAGTAELLVEDKVHVTIL